MYCLKTIGQVLQQFSELLVESETPRLDVEVLLGFVLGKNRSTLYAHPEQRLTSQQLKDFLALLQARAEGWPIAYLTGQREFWSMPLKVSQDTLIPRPETELLVEVCLEYLQKFKNPFIVDVGTGCGAIALAIAFERPDAHIIGIDISTAALLIAEQNRLRFGLKQVQFIAGNGLAALSRKKNRIQLIVSNPPYLASNDVHLKQGDLNYEPKMALVASNQGLYMYQLLAEQAKPLLCSTGLLAVEHGVEQKNQITKIFLAGGYRNCRSFCDLAGLDRVVCANR